MIKGRNAKERRKEVFRIYEEVMAENKKNLGPDVASFITREEVYQDVAIRANYSHSYCKSVILNILKGNE